MNSLSYKIRSWGHSIAVSFRNFIYWCKTLTWKKFLNTLKTFFSKPQNLIILFFTILLTVSVLIPLVSLFFDSFKVQHLQEAKTFNEQWNLNLKKGDWTWCQWPTALFTTQYDFSLKYFWTPLGQSILMAIVACLIAVIVGGVLAWFITRSNIPFKKYISTVFILHYIMHSWSIAMFW